jgi:hypothetical protein
MFKRRRFKQTLSLSERLVQDSEHLKAQLATLSPGPERDRLVKRIRQNETAANIEQWLKSPGLQPPQELGELGR